jgi:hypothetical protein
MTNRHWYLLQTFLGLLVFSMTGCGRIGYELLEKNSDEATDSLSDPLETTSVLDTSSADTPTDTGTGTQSDTGEDTFTGVESDSGDTGTQSDTSSADTSTGVASDSGDTGTQSDTSSADTSTGVASDSGDTGTQSDTGWDTSSDIQCSGKPDFTACALVTAPDRSYDICVAGICVSPGCGDATCNVPSPHFPLADTNQRSCADTSGLMTCPTNPSADFYGQDAQYGWDATHDQSGRYTRTMPVDTEPVVQDNVTGLVWQGCIARLSGASCASGNATGYKWSDALAYCDDLDWGGHTDWRLPDAYELPSIVDSGRMKPATDLAAFPETSSADFWSSSSYASNVSNAWFFSFEHGGGGYGAKTNSYRVRCVRGGPFQGRRFDVLSVSGHRLVRDTLTGLEWQGCLAELSGVDCTQGSAGSYSWKQALAYCEGLSYAGHTDWRLPSRTELHSSLDLRRYGPSIDSTAFPATLGTYTWSSTSNANVLSNAWYVYFGNGYVSNADKSGGYRIRCVRGGP